MYTLEATGLAAIDAWLSRYRRFWNEHFDSLDR